MKLRLLLVVVCLAAGNSYSQGLITTYAGTGWIFPGAPVAARSAPLGFVRTLVSDRSGNLYIPDSSNAMVFRLTRSGNLDVVAGNGVQGFSGDGGPATDASLSHPYGVAVDAAGNIYISDGPRVRRVNPEGVISTYAGTGRYGFSGDGGPAILATLQAVFELAVDASGTLYLWDTTNYRIRSVRPDGVIRTVAGNGVPGATGDNGPATSASVVVSGLAVDSRGRLYFSDFLNSRIRMIDGDGVIRLVADGSGLGTQGIGNPGSLAFDAQGSLIYVQSTASRVMRLGSDGKPSAIAGNGRIDYLGDGEDALQASFGYLYGMTLDPQGTVYVADSYCQCVRAFRPGQTVATVAGNGQFGKAAEGTPAVRSFLAGPTGLTFDRSGNLLVASSEGNSVDLFTREGLYRHVAGMGAGGCCLDGRAATKALVSIPQGVAVDGQNRIYVSQGGFHRIRRIASDGTIATFAGNGERGNGGDNGPGTQAQLDDPAGMVFDEAGNLYVASGAKIRKLTPAGVISTFAGDGQSRYAGDNGPATAASFRRVYALAFTSTGELLAADFEDHRVRKIGRDGRITTVAGDGRATSSGDNGPASSASLNGPNGLAVDSEGRIYVLERFGNRIRRIDEKGLITTVAGTGLRSFSGDGGASLAAAMNTPVLGIAIGPDGGLYFSDTANDRVRVIRRQSPRLSFDRELVSVSARPGQRLAQVLVEARSEPAGALFQTGVVSVEGGRWLTVTPAQGITPSTLQLEFDSAQLTVGEYRATVQLRSTIADPPLVNLPVTLRILQPTAPLLSVSPAAITLMAASGEVVRQSFTIANEGGASLPFEVRASTASGGAWLGVTPERGEVQATPVTVMVTAATSGLPTGTYSGALQIDAAEQQASVRVTLVVQEQPQPRILLSQAGLSFVAISAGSTPPPQTVAILNEGRGAMAWSASVSTLSGEDWLQVGPRSGKVDRPLLDVSAMTVSVAPRSLQAGEYYGRIDILAQAENSPQYVMVVLRVLPPGTQLPPEVTPAGLVFAAIQGSNPGSQTVTMTNLLSSETQYNSSRTTLDGQGWFVHSPTTSVLVPERPAKVVVQPDLSNLTPGVRRGAITWVFDDGSLRNVSLLAVVAPRDGQGVAEKPEGRSLLGCPSSELFIEVTSVRQNFVAIVGQPFPVEVKIVDGCSNPLTPSSGPGASVVASLSAKNQRSLVHTSGGVWSGSLVPQSVEGQVNLFVGVNVGNRISVAQRIGTVQAGGRTPMVTQGSLRHSATFETDVPVAPGQLISILGSNLAEGESRVDTVPFPLSLRQTEVLLAGRPLPLLYTSDGQINAQVPYDLPVNGLQQVLVRSGASLSVPEQFVVAEAQPGIFTKNASGFGQAIVLRASDGAIAEPATPAAKGEEVILYCTGLGRVQPAVEPGQPAPLIPAVVMAEVEVRIGDSDAPVRSATLSPGTAGLYEVRVVVPEDVVAGDEVRVVMRAARGWSQPVTMSIR